jgi:hypothetical protein
LIILSIEQEKPSKKALQMDHHEKRTTASGLNLITAIPVFATVAYALGFLLLNLTYSCACGFSDLNLSMSLGVTG